MAGARRLYLYWDPSVDGAFRQRLSDALHALNIRFDDGDGIEPDPENPGVAMAIASAADGWTAPRADILIQAGAGTFPADARAFRLEAGDVGASPRWARLLEKLRTELAMASLALPADELEVRLNDAQQRAEEAGKAVATAKLRESEAVRERDRLRADLVAAHTRAADLESENQRLRAAEETSIYALALVPAHLRKAVAQGRDCATRAGLAAAKAGEAAAAYPGAIAWQNRASYSGETKNGQPDGYGVMLFTKGAKTFAGYRGQFAKGMRHGLGVGLDGDGHVWSGEWLNDDACGFGVLEGAQGQRYEGEARPNDKQPQSRGEGYRWPGPSAQARPPRTHGEIRPRLPGPAPASD